MAGVYSTKGKDILLDGKVVSSAASPEMAVTMAQNSAKKLGGTYQTTAAPAATTSAPVTATKTAAQRAQEQEAAAYKAAGVTQPVASPTVTPTPSPVKTSTPPAGATLISGPSGLAGLSETQIWRDPNSSKIYKLAGSTAPAPAPTVTPTPAPAPAPAPTTTTPTPTAPSTIPFIPGLSESQKSGITNLSKKTGQWTETDMKNWNYATGGAALPPGAVSPAGTTTGAAATPTGTQYTVKSGDTLSGLASQYGTTVAELMRLNPQITNPNQIFAGKAITLPGTSPAAGGAGTTAPSVDQANADINSEQDADIASKTVTDEPPTRKSVEDIMADITKAVTPETPAPVVPDTSALLEQRRTEYGVQDLETQVNDIQAQLAEVEANKRARIASERGKAVAMNVISGRIGEAERQENERIDALNRQLVAASNILQTKYNIVETLMKADATDYANATAAYDKQFSQNISLFNAAKNIEDSEKSEEERAADNARANAQIVLNTMSKQGQSFADLTPAQQASLTQMGVESGLGADFFKNVAETSGNKEILTTIKSDDDSTVSVVYKDGTSAIFKTGIKNRVAGSGGTPSAPKTTDADVAAAIKDGLAGNNAYGSDGKVSWETYLWMRQNWQGTEQEFNIQFPIGQYLDSANQSAYKAQIGK